MPNLDDLKTAGNFLRSKAQVRLHVLRNYGVPEVAAAAVTAKRTGQTLEDVLTVSRVAAQEAQLKRDFRPDPEVANLVLGPAQGETPLPGRSEKTVLQDQFGHRWLFKKAETPYRSVGEVQAGKFFRAVGLDVPPTHLWVHEGRLGTLTRLVDVKQRGLDPDPAKLSARQAATVLETQVASHTWAEYDRKALHFLVKPDDTTVPIDVDGVFYNFPHDHLDAHYQQYRSTPLQNRLWQAYAHGRVDVDLAPGLAMARRIQAMPEDQFRALLRPYAEARYAFGDRPDGLPTAQAFEDAVVARKRNLVTEVSGFYDGLAKQRGLEGLQEALVTSPAGRES